MTTAPFLCFSVGRKRDAIRARHCARQIASLLHFPIEHQACIAAGTFVIACQGLAAYGRFVLCFQIESNQLQVHARPPHEERGMPAGWVNRLAGLACANGEMPLKLVKQLPGERTLAEADLAWLVQLAEEESGGIFEEIVKQNQEVLALLHELHTLKKPREEGQAAQPNAA